MTNAQPTSTRQPKRQQPGTSNPALWQEGAFAVRFQRKSYCVVMKSGGKGQPKVVERFRHEDQAIEHGKALYKRWSAGEVIECLADREKRLKAEAVAGQESSVPVSPHASSGSIYGFADEGDELLTEAQARLRFPWSSARFTYVDCNSVAVIWRCTAYDGENGSGRRSPTGKHQAPLPHIKGDYAVSYITYGKEAVADAVRDNRGRPKVFKSFRAAEEAALEYYDRAPEDDKFPLVDTTITVRKLVSKYGQMDVYVDTANNGYKRPFEIWVNLPGGGGKPLYRNDPGGRAHRFSTPEQAYNFAIKAHNTYFGGIY